MKQLNLLKSEPKAYGGSLLKTRKGRSRGRPLATKQSMHLVLRSSKAKGEWSFRKAENRRKISELIKKFGARYGVRILSLANVGNHLHIQIQLTVRHGYKPFIRALLTLKDLIRINQIEGVGISREQARMIVRPTFSSA